MRRQLTSSTTLASIKKTAKRWLQSVRSNDPAAQIRLRKANAHAPNPPCLRDIQHAIAIEFGFANWQALKQGLESVSNQIAATSQSDALDTRNALPNPYYIDKRERSIAPKHPLDESGWDRILSEVQNQRIPAIHAAGQMTDAVLERVSRLDHVTALHLGGSQQITEAGLKHIANMPQLQVLELGGAVTDRALESLQQLTRLRAFQMCWQTGVSDAGIANLSFCELLESADLMGSTTGDGAILALSGKENLRHFKTGREVTDAGLLYLHQIPTFKTWAGGRARNSLMSASAEPNQIVIDGPFSDDGVSTLAGLEGLYALSFFWHSPSITPQCLTHLADLPHLGVLGCEGKFCNDEAMSYIARLPQLRKLMAQGTIATDVGFAELSRSRTLEYIWGRECPNLTGRGFAALSKIRTLRGLAVSCKNVDDEALSALPQFPALKELMPMDVPDAGFRHIGACQELESLWCMYCRSTTDAATEQLSMLPRLKSYYAGSTLITDKSLAILSSILSLESVAFWKCAGITDEGLRLIAALPRLKKVTLEGLSQVTEAGPDMFPAQVYVKYTP